MTDESAFVRARWRLLNGGLADGATNMAIDEAVMLAVAAGKSLPTIRFYGWEPFCLSVGYAQAMTKEVDLEACRAAGIDCVRRPTGGRAVFHADELTYSIVAPQEEPRVAGGIVESYRRLSLGLTQGLAYLGLDAWEAAPQRGPAKETSAVCFDAPSHYEVTVGGHKLIGSAQMRRKGMVLQHGSLPLWGDITRILGYLRLPSEERRAALREDLRAKATTLEQVMGRALTFDTVASAIAAGFAATLNLELLPEVLTPDEEESATQLRREKYATAEWNLQR
jgi:lipoyl(octanoyl) transferase